jgi:hypothetical protein
LRKTSVPAGAADCPPFGSNRIHEIKHDGYRLRAFAGIRGN